MARPVGVWRRGGRGFEGVGFGVGVMGGRWRGIVGIVFGLFIGGGFVVVWLFFFKC